MVCELVFTAAMSIPIFNTPRPVAVSLPRSESTLPLITQNSALVVFLPAEASHENVPITSNGVWDAYAKSFLSERADLHFTLFLFSDSHVCLSMILVLAPESRRDFNILKLTHKAIHSSDFPEYLSLELRNVHTHNLRSSEAPLLLVPKETGTFQHSAASIFNKLPSALRNIKDYNSFCRSLRKYLSSRVK